MLRFHGSAMRLLQGVAIVSLVASTAATAAQEQLDVAMPAQHLGDALRQLALLSGKTILADAALVEDRQAPAIHGNYTVRAALQALLDGSDLVVTSVGGAFVVRAKPASPSTTDGKSDSEILVTGTRIRGAAPVGSHVITIDRDAIDRSGYATTQQIVQSLPQNFGGGPNEGTVGFSVRNNANSNFGFGSSANLRGLGTTSTLVLVDGNRAALGGGTFVDLTLIPSSAIDRVEVLADGASALYGSDAVAGVINVKLRNDFHGSETRLRTGFADGFNEIQASQLIGLRWASGHVTIGYEYYHRSRLGTDARDYATEDLRRFGGPDYRKDYANPGTIIAANGRTFAIPAGQNGIGLTAADLQADAVNLSDGRAQTDVLPALSRHALYAAVEQELAPWLRFTAQGFFADRLSTTRIFPDNYGGVVVPTTNPFYVDPIGTGEPVTVNYAFVPDLGPATLSAHVRNWTGVGGLTATLGRWSAALHGSYGSQTEYERATNIPNYYYLGQALGDTNPATAYNVFGDGSVTNPRTIDTIRGSYDQVGQSRVWATDLKFDGPLAHLPAGDIRVAFGSEFRRERYACSGTDFEFSAAPVDQGTAGYPIGRSVAAAYAEMLVPLIAPEQHVPGIAKLDLSLAGRVEHYSDFGSTTNPKVGVRWQPVEGVTLRSTFGTSFRAPGFDDTRQGKGTRNYVPFPLADPASPTGTTNVLLLFGANSDVRPERATTWTAGIDLNPVALPGVRLSLTGFDIAYRNRIASLGTDYLSFLTNRSRYQSILTDHPDPALVARYYADENFNNPFGIAASDIAVIADGRTVNLARVHQQGLDFDLGYQFRRGTAQLEAGVSGAWLFKIDQQITATAPVANVVSTIGNPVDLRLRGRFSAIFDRLGIAGFVNYVDGYRNTAVAPIEPVHSWTTLDLQLAYDLGRDDGPLKGLKLSLGVTNAFNRAPPYVNNSTVFSASGFDPENANALGRVVALQVNKTW